MPLARDFRQYARNSLKDFWGRAVLVSFVAGLLGGSTSGGGSGGGSAGSSAGSASGGAGYNIFEMYPWLIPLLIVLVVLVLVMLVLGSAVELGACSFFSRTALGERPPFSTLFSRFDIFFKALGLRLYMALLVFLWSLLFIIPGIVAGYRYAMAPYLMAEYPEMGIREAVNRSKQLMDGNKGRLFCLEWSFIGWNLLGALTLGILMLWVNPYIATSNAAFYLHLTGRVMQPPPEEGMPRPGEDAPGPRTETL